LFIEKEEAEAEKRKCKVEKEGGKSGLRKKK